MLSHKLNKGQTKCFGMPNWHKKSETLPLGRKSHGKTSPATQDTVYFFPLPTQEKGCYAHFSPKLPMANITELMVKGLHPTDHSFPIQQPLSNPLIELWARNHIKPSTLSRSRLKIPWKFSHTRTSVSDFSKMLRGILFSKFPYSSLVNSRSSFKTRSRRLRNALLSTPSSLDYPPLLSLPLALFLFYHTDLPWTLK